MSKQLYIIRQTNGFYYDGNVYGLGTDDVRHAWFFKGNNIPVSVTGGVTSDSANQF